jgi:hypothetical protein
MPGRWLTMTVLFWASLCPIAVTAAGNDINDIAPPVMVELPVGRSDLVVRGTIVDVEVNPPHLRLRVIETFKGPTLDVVEFDEMLYPQSFVGREIYAFATQADGGRWKRSGPHHMLVEPGPVPFKFFDVNMRPLRDRDTRLAAVRAAAVAYPGPASAGPGILRTAWIDIPGDARTEAAVARAAQSADTDEELRMMAIMILGARKTDFARSTLRALLEDTTLGGPVDGEGKWKRGIRFIRWVADFALSGQTDLQALVFTDNQRFEGPALGYRPVARATLRRWAIAVGVAVGCVLIALSFRQVRRIAPRPGTSVALVSLALAGALGALLIRSYRWTDELMLGRSARHHELAARRGRIVYTLVRNWVVPTPGAAGSTDDWQTSERLQVGHFPDVPDLWAPNAAPQWSRIGISKTTDTIAGPFKYTHPYTTVTIPMWLPMVTLLIAPGVAIARRVQIMRRRLRNRCGSCGYDLRESPGRCPECGREPTGW